MSKSIAIDRVKLIAEMARQDITGEELARRACVCRSAVTAMRCSRPVWRNTARRVAQALNVPLESLLPDQEA